MSGKISNDSITMMLRKLESSKDFLEQAINHKAYKEYSTIKRTEELAIALKSLERAIAGFKEILD